MNVKKIKQLFSMHCMLPKSRDLQTAILYGCSINKGASICILKPWMKTANIPKIVPLVVHKQGKPFRAVFSVLVLCSLVIRTDSLYSVAISDCSMEDKYSARCHGYDREHIHTNRAVRPRGYTPTQLSLLSIHKHHV